MMLSDEDREQLQALESFQNEPKEIRLQMYAFIRSVNVEALQRIAGASGSHTDEGRAAGWRVSE